MDSVKTEEKGKLGWKNLAKAALFTLILVILLLNVSRVMTVDNYSYEHRMISGVFEEPPGSLDAVYIGSSTTFTYWNSLAGFSQHGIAMMPLGSDSQSIAAAESLIRQARELHPDALYIVNINSAAGDGIIDLGIHNVVDHLPFSLEKLRLTHTLLEYEDIPWKDRLEYYFPLIRFHSRWDLLHEGYFIKGFPDYKNSFDSDWYAGRIQDISGDYHTSSQTGSIREKVLPVFQSLLDYCDREQVNVLFVTVPQAQTQETAAMFNGVNALISSRGYPVLDLMAGLEETDLHLQTDFYNGHHTNIHGSLKFTDYLARYLKEHYGFADKRQDPAYQSWHEAVENYRPWLERCTLDFEREQGSRDYSLQAVEDLKARAGQGSVTLSWAAETAEGFAIYCRAAGGWEQIAQTDALEFTDTGLEKGVSYTYTVVPFRRSGDALLYGNFPYNGVEVTVEKAG